MAILVTGGTGFLGQEVVAQLRAAGQQVKVLARHAPAARGGSQGQAGAVTYLCGSVLDPAAVRAAVEGCEQVLHLAGRVDWRGGAMDLMPLHVSGTRHVLEAAAEAGVKRVVHVSTSGTVGISEDLEQVADEDSPYATRLARRWPYYLSKIYAEKTALEADAAGRVPVVVVSPGLLLGPGDARVTSTALVDKFLRRALPLVPPGVLALVDVRDAAAAVCQAAQRGAPGQRYLLGSNLSFADLFERLEALSGVPAPVLRVSAELRGVARSAARGLGIVQRALGGEGALATELELAGYSWAISCARAKEALGFAPRPLDVTLADTIADLRQRSSSEEELANAAAAEGG